MAGRQGFITNGQTFVYQESKVSSSAAFGIDTGDTDTWKLRVDSVAGALPSTNPQMEIDPVTNGSIYFTPNGTGVMNFDNDQVSAASNQLTIRKTRNVAPITSGDALGAVSFQGIGTGTTFTEGAAITSTSSGTIGANRVAGDLVFKTHPDSASGATATTRMIIASTGEVTVAAPDSGIGVTVSGGGVTITAGDLTFGAATGGNINLAEPLSSASGVITGYDYFSGAWHQNTLFHNYGGNAGGNNQGHNIFAGYAAGNFTLTLGSARFNAGFGDNSLHALTTGAGNTALGNSSGELITTGIGNTALGGLRKLTTGSFNTVIGGTDNVNGTAGLNYTSSESNNIIINNLGTTGESNVLRIGTATGTGTWGLNKAYICGIDGVDVGSVAKVLTMASDQIGTATITAGSGITVTPGSNTITIASTASGTGLTWNDATGDATMAVNNGYVIDNGSTKVTLTLPATAALGSVFAIAGFSSGGWRLAQAASQVIHFGNQDTSTGTGGYLEFTHRYDCVEIVCVVADTEFTVRSSIGNLTVV